MTADKFRPWVVQVKHFSHVYLFQFGSGSCTGDSGGPLIFHNKLSNPSHYVQVGIVQGGAGECGNERFPGVYARLDDHKVLSFIYKTAFGKTIDTALSSPPGKNTYLYDM